MNASITELHILKLHPMFAVVLFITFCCSLTTAQPAEEESNDEQVEQKNQEAGWELVWSDEFNYEGLPDSTKWGYEVGYIRNNEKQYYTKARPENARVEDGHLVIEARKEEYKGYDYTSASLTTRNKAEWKYGKIEVRANLPTGRGMWPAIWMLGTNIDEVGWPACGEIDIMENVGYDPSIVYSTIHTEAYNHTKGTSKGNGMQVFEVWKKFITYSVEWTPEELAFFIGNERYFGFSKESDDPAVWPFDQKFYLIINAAVGGSWGGQEGIDDSIFPQQYLIDYVRVYKKE